MNNDLYTYSKQMQHYLEAQEKRIQQLEQEVKRLTEEISVLKNKPPIHVDRIEYKFDQLKVESLDGTLNIGLNPNDLNNIDELAVNHQPVSPSPFPFPHREQVVKEMAKELITHLDEMIRETEAQVGITLDSTYHDFIKQDVERQLEQRIHMYFDHSLPNERAPHQFEHLKEKVFEKVKSDIQVALMNFITHSQGQTGGNQPNGI
ncbi:spore germination protein GerPC [Peribacillus sp. Hz7]|uniref:spore germination protein GerPC n=1 Tax=Peribacillus sp. Hz7 TaxID=3344873 RepID=UPI0035CC39F1